MSLSKPHIMYHGVSPALGRPNSSEMVRAAAWHDSIDIIEIDVRKSADGVLYCLHGPLMLAWFARFFRFKTLQGMFGVERLIDVISPALGCEKILFLDIKDRSIRHQDFHQIVQHHRQVWFAGYSVRQLQYLKRVGRQADLFICNFSFLSFSHGLRKAKQAGLDGYKLFPWQCTQGNIELLRREQLHYAVQPIFLTRKKYAALLNRFGSLWVALDDPSRPENFLMRW